MRFVVKVWFTIIRVDVRDIVIRFMCGIPIETCLKISRHNSSENVFLRLIT